MPRSRMNPRICPSCAADLAHTTITSAIGALEIHVLRAGQPIAVRHLLGARRHGAGVGPGIGLGEAEGAHPLAGGEPGQVLHALRLGAIGIDGVHDERGLHRVHGPEPAVHPLHLAGDQSVGHVVGPGAAVLLGDGDAQQPQRPHLGEDGPVGLLLQIGLDHARAQLVLGVGARRVADRPLLLAELVLQQERIVPDEGRFGRPAAPL